MNWQKMIEIEPQLQHLADSATRARQQGAAWVDFWAVHVQQLTHLVGPVARHPGLRSDRAWKVCLSHLLQTWIDAMAEPSTLPWDARPVVSTGGA